MRIEKGNAKWMVYDEYENEIWWAFTKEEAMRLAQKMLDSYADYDWNIPDQIVYGGVIVAKIVAESAFMESYYDDPDNWPYGNIVDEIGYLYMKEVEEG